MSRKSSSETRVVSNMLPIRTDSSQNLRRNDVERQARSMVTRTARSHSATGMSCSSATLVASSNSMPGVTPSCPPSRFW